MKRLADGYAIAAEGGVVDWTAGQVRAALELQRFEDKMNEVERHCGFCTIYQTRFYPEASFYVDDSSIAHRIFLCQPMGQNNFNLSHENDTTRVACG